MKVGTFFKIPLFIHWSVPAFMAFIFFLRHEYEVSLLNVGRINLGTISLIFIGMCYLFVILHEYGHCFVAQYMGLSIKDVTIYCLGGMAKIKFTSNSPIEEFWVTVGGPIVNAFFVVLFLPFTFFMTLPPWPELLVKMALFVNIVLFVFNMIPVLPMDGGRIFRSSLAYFTGKYTLSTVIVARFSQILSLCLCIFAFYNELIMMGIIFTAMIYFAQAEIQRARLLNSLENIKVSLSMILGKPELLKADLREIICELDKLEDKSLGENVSAESLAVLLRNFVEEEGLQPGETEV